MSGVSNYLDKLSDQVDNINTCEELLAFKTKVETQLTKLIADMNDQTAKLQQLSVPPVDLATTINWIKLQIDLYVKPAIAMVEETQQIASALVSLTQKITNKASSLGCSWAP